MPTRQINPISETSTVILTSTGSADLVAATVPFGVYTGSADFLSGAALQVAYVFKKLGGDVVDIELTPANVYSAYEEAVLEYSYIINLHQSQNVMSGFFRLFCSNKGCARLRFTNNLIIIFCYWNK